MKETIKDLPMSERPYEKCETYGPKVLSDAELLAVILRTGSKDVNSVQLAHQILMKDNTHKDLTGLMYLTREQLMEIPGIGNVKANQLMVIAELARRLSIRNAEEAVVLGNPMSIAEYFMNDLRFATQEYVYAVYLNQCCKMIKKQMITKGTLNASLISPREIYMEALKCNAANVVLVHNHPSGNVRPSPEDRQVTLQVKECGDMLNIPLVDHIITGDMSYYSFAEAGTLNQSRKQA